MNKHFIPLLLASLIFSNVSTVQLRSYADIHNITVDGLKDDWNGIEPVFVDPNGDMKYATDKGSDIKAIYTAKDNEYLYLMIEFYGKANRGNLLDLYFEPLGTFELGNFQFGVNGFVSWAVDAKRKGIIVGYNDVAEVGIPLRLLEGYPLIGVNPMVYIPSLGRWDDSAGRWVTIWIDESKGLHLEYKITIHEPSRLIEISEHVWNLSFFQNFGILFKFNSHWVYRTYQRYLVNLTFISNDQVLSNHRIDEDVWSVDFPEAAEEVCAHYFLNLSGLPAHSNYFGEDFLVAYVGSLFLYPYLTADGVRPVSGIRFKFELPKDWSVATQWDKDGEEFFTKNVEYIKRGFIAIGKYSINESTVDNVTLMVAVYHETEIPVSMLMNYSRSSFSYLMGFLKFPFPDANRFLVIFAPPPSMCGAADFCGPSCTVDSMTKPIGLWVLPHEMFHILDGFSGGILEEGMTQYYGYKTSLCAGLWNLDDFYQWLTIYGADGIKYYYTNIWNTTYDLPITSDKIDQMLEKNPVDWWNYAFVRARKMAIVAYMLDREIEEVTNGSKGLNDVISYLNAKYQDPEHYVPPEELLETIDTVSGHNFSDFFASYVFGVKMLPPIPINDYFRYWTNVIEQDLAKVNPTETRERFEGELKVLRERCDAIINLILEEKFYEAFQKMEEVLDDFKNLLDRMHGVAEGFQLGWLIIPLILIASGIMSVIAYILIKKLDRDQRYGESITQAIACLRHSSFSNSSNCVEEA